MDLIDDESDEGDTELQKAIAESLRNGRLIFLPTILDYTANTLHPNIPAVRPKIKRCQNCQVVREGLYVYTLLYQASPLSPVNSTPFQLKRSNFTCGEPGIEVYNQRILYTLVRSVY